MSIQSDEAMRAAALAAWEIDVARARAAGDTISPFALYLDGFVSGARYAARLADEEGA